MEKFRAVSLVIGLGISVSSIVACGGAPPPKAKPKPPAALGKLADERKALLEKYAAVADPLREKCEFAHGECLMQARDERYDILGVHVFAECDAKSGDEKMFCEENGAVGEGLGERMVYYYQMHNSCLHEMMQCTAKLVEEAEEEARVELAHKRKQTVEALDKSEALRVEARTMEKAVAYLRSTLPPNEEGACQNLPEAVECRSAVGNQDEEFKTELVKDDGDYDEALAAELYQQARTTEASCGEPELRCLHETARRYGATQQTELAFKRNVDIIKQRELLSGRIGDKAASRCENAAVAKHQGDIISAYTTYVRQPVLFFRNKLHQVFMKMHREQVDCLKRGDKTSALSQDDRGQRLARR